MDKLKLYLRVTNDQYELPVAVAESPKELAQLLGITANNVKSSISHKVKTYCVVEVEDDLEKK